MKPHEIAAALTAWADTRDAENEVAPFDTDKLERTRLLRAAVEALAPTKLTHIGMERDGTIISVKLGPLVPNSTENHPDIPTPTATVTVDVLQQPDDSEVMFVVEGNDVGLRDDTGGFFGAKDAAE